MFSQIFTVFADINARMHIDYKDTDHSLQHFAQGGMGGNHLPVDTTLLICLYTVHFSWEEESRRAQVM